MPQPFGSKKIDNTLPHLKVGTTYIVRRFADPEDYDEIEIKAKRKIKDEITYAFYSVTYGNEHVLYGTLSYATLLNQIGLVKPADAMGAVDAVYDEEAAG